MSAGDRRAARPHGGAGRQLGSGVAQLICALWAGVAAAGPCAPAAHDPAALEAARKTGDPAALCVLDATGAPLTGVSVEIADDDDERAQGLMGRTALAPGSGMLFLYDSPRGVAFWMHDTLIPLDMVFIDAAGRIARIHADARPLDETPIPSGGPVRYVLEIGGGQAARLGLAPGQAVAPLAAAGN